MPDRPDWEGFRNDLAVIGLNPFVARCVEEVARTHLFGQGEAACPTCGAPKEGTARGLLCSNGFHITPATTERTQP